MRGMTAKSPDPGAEVPLQVRPATVAEPVGGKPLGMQPTNRSLTLTRLRVARFLIHPLFLIACVSWVANFLHFQGFGYYEDDWYYFPTGFSQPLVARLEAIFPLVKGLFQGRPGVPLFATLFAYAGRALSSITAPYLVVFCLFATTACLFYGILRMRFPRLFCTIAALLFVLSPLTTVRQNLLIGCVQGAVFVCVLTAILLRRRQPAISYLLAVVAIFSYESIFLLFLAAPFFEPGRLCRKKKILEIGVHLAVCALVLVAVLTLRQAIGEQKVVTAFAPGPGALIGRAVAMDVSYSARSFLMYQYAAQVAWNSTTLEPIVYLAGFALCAFLALFRRRLLTEGTTGGGFGRLNRVRLIWWLWNGCALSLVLIALGFLTIYFQTSGNNIAPVGRDTRFAASAVPGSSMFLASLTMLVYLTVRRRTRWVVWMLLSSFLSVLFVYSFVVQDDYVRAWDYEKNLFSQIVLLTPDLKPNGLIVVRTGDDALPGFGPKERIASIGWQRFGELVSLKCVGDWVSSPEIIFVGSDDWKNNLAFGPDGKLHWTQRASGSMADSVVPGGVIVLDERADGLLTRSDEAVSVNGKVITRSRDDLVNLALGKPARQSSTYGPYTAEHGVDGHGATLEYSAWKAIAASHVLQHFVAPPARTALVALAGESGYAGFSTNSEPSPWWEVDLGRPSVLQQIRVYNAGPGVNFQRAASLRVLLSDDDVRWRIAYDNRGKVFGPEPLSVNLADVAARYVRLQLVEPNQFQLEQVEVFGH
jgi:hypothetical protein